MTGRKGQAGEYGCQLRIGSIGIGRRSKRGLRSAIPGLKRRLPPVPAVDGDCENDVSWSTPAGNESGAWKVHPAPAGALESAAAVPSSATESREIGSVAHNPSPPRNREHLSVTHGLSPLVC